MNSRGQAVHKGADSVFGQVKGGQMFQASVNRQEATLAEFFYIVEGQRVVQSEVANSKPHETFQRRGQAQAFAQINRQAPNVSALAAINFNRR